MITFRNRNDFRRKNIEKEDDTASTLLVPLHLYDDFLQKTKKHKGKNRTKEEDEKLTRLSEELADLGFAQDFRDPMYAKFVQQMALKTKFQKEVLTSEEIEEQDRIASEIIDQILAEEKKSL